MDSDEDEREWKVYEKLKMNFTMPFNYALDFLISYVNLDVFYTLNISIVCYNFSVSNLSLDFKY